LVVAACSESVPAKPEIPDSISPGWKLVSLASAPRPAEVAPDGDPRCWKAEYTGSAASTSGTAEVAICWYKVSGNAFEALQRTRAEAQAVKFQQEHYFILVKWNNAPKANVTALVRALEKALGGSHA
jgi:hypothetical protein